MASVDITNAMFLGHAHNVVFRERQYTEIE